MVTDRDIAKAKFYRKDLYNDSNIFSEYVFNLTRFSVFRNAVAGWGLSDSTLEKKERPIKRVFLSGL